MSGSCLQCQPTGLGPKFGPVWWCGRGHAKLSRAWQSRLGRAKPEQAEAEPRGAEPSLVEPIWAKPSGAEPNMIRMLILTNLRPTGHMKLRPTGLIARNARASHL